MHRGDWTAIAAGLAVVFALGRAEGKPQAKLIALEVTSDDQEKPSSMVALVLAGESHAVDDVIALCADLSGAAAWQCRAAKLSAPDALFSPAPLPDVLRFEVSGARLQPELMSRTRYGESAARHRVGTAWLIAIDVTTQAKERLADAKALAAALVRSMPDGDMASIWRYPWAHDEVAVWRDAGLRANLLDDIEAVETRANASDAIFEAAKRVFDSQNVDAPKWPLRETVVLLSGGVEAPDREQTRADVQALTDGVPATNYGVRRRRRRIAVVSIELPIRGAPIDGADHLETNPEVGGLAAVLQSGDPAAIQDLVARIRDRANSLWILEYRLPCFGARTPSHTAPALHFRAPADWMSAGESDEEWGAWFDRGNSRMNVDLEPIARDAAVTPLRPGQVLTVRGEFCSANAMPGSSAGTLTEVMAIPFGDRSRNKRRYDDVISSENPEFPVKILGMTSDTLTFELPSDPGLFETDRITLWVGDQPEGSMSTAITVRARGPLLDRLRRWEKPRWAEIAALSVAAGFGLALGFARLARWLWAKRSSS